SSPSVVRRVEGIEDLLPAVHVLARADRLVLLDLRLRARADHLRDRERAEQDEPAVVDLERVAVERAHGRAGGAVALRVVLAAVAGAAEAGGHDGVERERAVRGLLGERRHAEDRARRPVRLHGTAEMRAAVRDDREARYLLRALRHAAVVADEGGAAIDVAFLRVDVERRDVPLAFLELADRPHVDAMVLLPEERRQHGEARDRDGDQPADHAAEAERRALEEAASREALTRRRRRHRRTARRGGRADLPGAGLAQIAPLRDDDDRLAAQLARGVAPPEDAEDDRDRGADRRDPERVDDQSDEKDGDADRESDRPERGRRQMLLVLLVHLVWIQPRPPLARQRRSTWRNERSVLRIEPFSAPGPASSPYSPQRRSTSARISGDISICLGHGRAPSSTHFAVASMPSLPPTNCRSGAWSRWSSGPVPITTSGAGSTFAPA